MVVRARNPFVLCVSVLFLGSGCAAPTASQHLSQAEAIRIADAEIRKQYHVPIDSFERAASYVASRKSWIISYHPRFIGDRPHSRRRAALVMDVDEKTRKAGMIVE